MLIRIINIILLMVIFCYGQSKVKWRDLAPQTQKTISDLAADSAESVIQDSIAFPVDTLALQQLNMDEGRVAELKQLSSSNPNGGGRFIVRLKTDLIVAVRDSTEDGINIFDHPTSILLWIRQKYFENPGNVWLTDAGAIPNDDISDVAAFTKCYALADTHVTSNDTTYGITVRLPAGEFIIDDTVSTYSQNISIIGNEAQLIHKSSEDIWAGTNNTIIRMKGNDLIAFDFPCSTYVEDDSVRLYTQTRFGGPLFRGMHFVNDDIDSTIAACIRVRGKYNTRIENCTFNRIKDGVAIWTDTTRVYIGTSLSTITNVSGHLLNNKFVRVDTCFKHFGGNNWSIKGNWFIYRASWNVASDSSSIGIYSTSSGNWRVMDNQFEALGTAWKVQGEGNKFIANDMDGCHIGSHLYGASDQNFMAFNEAGADTLIVDETTDIYGNTYIFNHTFTTTKFRIDSSNHKIIQSSGTSGVLFSNGPTSGTTLASGADSYWDFATGAVRIQDGLNVGPVGSTTEIDSIKVSSSDLIFYDGATEYKASGLGGSTTFGGMYFFDSTATCGITQGDWEPANNAGADLWTADTLQGVTFGSDRIEPDAAGVYQISGVLTFSGTATDTIQMAFQIGAAVDSTHQSSVVIPTGGITTMSLTRTAYVAAAADIKFRVQNISSSDDLALRSGSISLIRVD